MGTDAKTQGDWSAMGDSYAANRGTFQAAYAHAFWDRMRARPNVAAAVDCAERVVDVGCGTGEFTAALAELLPDAAVEGVDISPDMVARARRSFPRVAFAAADLAANGDAPSGPFDAATDDDAPLAGPDAALAGVAALLAPGGLFLGGLHGAGSCQEGVDALEAAAANRGPALALDALPTMFRRDGPDAWRAALDAAGFEAVDVREEVIVTPYSDVDEARRRLARGSPILGPLTTTRSPRSSTTRRRSW
ncbi:methyltransferase domain-containing protein [Aureococcus anophagefferens]|nr:methyltransferase domain-containing protein [Aureococcus anophagefferens]